MLRLIQKATQIVARIEEKRTHHGEGVSGETSRMQRINHTLHGFSKGLTFAITTHGEGTLLLQRRKRA